MQIDGEESGYLSPPEAEVAGSKSCRVRHKINDSAAPSRGLWCILKHERSGTCGFSPHSTGNFTGTSL